MLQTFGPRPRLKTTTITTNQKGTVSPATGIHFMGSSKFLANKKYKAIRSLCLAEAKGYGDRGQKSLKDMRTPVWKKEKKAHWCWRLSGVSVSDAANPSVSISKARRPMAAFQIAREATLSAVHGSQPKAQGPCEAMVGDTEDFSLFPGITRLKSSGQLLFRGIFFFFSIEKERRKTFP